MNEINWKVPKAIKEILNDYYLQYYNKDYEEFIAEYGAADFIHDERLVVFVLSKCKEVFKHE